MTWRISLRRSKSTSSNIWLQTTLIVDVYYSSTNLQCQLAHSDEWANKYLWIFIAKYLHSSEQHIVQLIHTWRELSLWHLSTDIGLEGKGLVLTYAKRCRCWGRSCWRLMKNVLRPEWCKRKRPIAWFVKLFLVWWIMNCVWVAESCVSYLSEQRCCFQLLVQCGFVSTNCWRN